MTALLASVAEGAAEHAHSEPPLGVTLLFAAILLGLIASLALEEKIHAKKSLITGLFAVLSLFLATVFDANISGGARQEIRVREHAADGTPRNNEVVL